MTLQLDAFMSLFAVVIQAFLAYQILCRRSRGAVHRWFAATLACLAVWNLGMFLITIPSFVGSRIIMILTFMGVIGVAPCALRFAAAYVQVPVRYGKMLLFAAGFSTLALLLNPGGMFWNEGVTWIWHTYIMLYLLLLVGLALAILSRAMPRASGRVRRLQYRYLLYSSLLFFIGGLTEILDIYTSVPSLGNVASAVWSMLMAYSILRFRFLRLQLAARGLAGFLLLVMVVVASVIGLVALASLWVSKEDAIVLSLAIVLGLYWLLSVARPSWLRKIGYESGRTTQTPEEARALFRKVLEPLCHADSILAAWKDALSDLLDEVETWLYEPQEEDRQLLIRACDNSHDYWSGQCLERELLESEALLSGQDSSLGCASIELNRLLTDIKADVISVPDVSIASPWLALRHAHGHSLNLAENETLILKAYSQEVSAALSRVDMLQRLRQSDRLAMAGSVASRVAHEIKNPLGTIKGAIQVMQQELPQEHSTREWFNLMLEEINRLDNVIQGYLKLAKPQSAKLEKVAVHALLERLVASVHARRDWPLEEEWDWNEGGEEISADPEQLTQIFLNLLINASHAMEDNPRLIITGKPETLASVPGFRITIRDFGKGMDKETLTRAFEPFFTRKARGSGLGLAITRDLVEGMGGEITLESEPGEGAAVSLWFSNIKEEA
jgi:signal transduction histidine kinase